MKILFLDVDGVLNHSESMRFGRGPKSFDPNCVAQLNRVLEAAGAKIVVSSTWRFMYDVQAFNGMLLLAGIKPVAIDRTELRDAARGVGSVWKAVPRRDQIRRWLAHHPEVTTYAVVDDSTYVRTHFDGGGLRAEHADQLIRILNGEATLHVR